MKNLLVALLFLLSLRSTAQVRVQHLRCENLENPLGLDEPRPRLSWQLLAPAGRRGTRQTAYEVRVAATTKALAASKALVWGSGQVASDSSVSVAYAGPGLQAGHRYHWQVRVWDEHGRPSAWSAPAYWQTGLLAPANWRATWIGPGYAGDSVLGPSPLLRKEFVVRKKVRQATAYFTAHGLYEAQLNGHRVGDTYLAPGWTSYAKRLAYQAYDVTTLLREGPNALGVTLGSGWWRGPLAWQNRRNHYGRDVALLCQVEMVYADGSTETINSDGSWQSTDKGPIRTSELQRGETYDARLEQPGWASPGFRAAGWVGVSTPDYPRSTLVASGNEPIRQHETFRPVKVLRAPTGETILDFGQNLAGWVRVQASGRAGDYVRLSHAEVLQPDGNLYLANLRTAAAEDTYYLRGTGQPETFTPHFTTHGFRYVRVDHYPGQVQPEAFTAVALYSDLPATGTFHCSDALVNQLQSNIEWSQKGNFLDVPTDCPQRDERLGWTGDAQVFARTACFNRGANNFFAKWLRDLAADQRPSGGVPVVVPDLNIGFFNTMSPAAWSDAATIVPWELYTVYGDRRTLARQYASMKAWVGYVAQRSPNGLWDKGVQLGDWLAFDLDNDLAGRSAVTNRYLVAQCLYANSVRIMRDAAQVLGYPADVAYYTALLATVKAAFRQEYVTPGGALVSSTQTAYVLALHFDLLPDSQRQQAADRLAANVAAYSNHLTTGFVGTPYLCEELSRFGHPDVAYELLLQKTYPSWLYPVTKGATTIWERWDSQRPDGSFAPPSMTSFNHYAYGAVGDWLYRRVAGLDTDGPGYRHLRVRPQPGGGFTEATAELLTNYGPSSAQWQLRGSTLVLDVTVPPNATATICVPTTDPTAVRESGQALASASGLTLQPAEPGYCVVKVSAGHYQFVAPWIPTPTPLLADYPGTYQVAGETAPLVVALGGGGLQIGRAGGPLSALTPLDGSPDFFTATPQFTGGPVATIRFWRGAQHRVVRLEVRTLGSTEAIRQD